MKITIEVSLSIGIHNASQKDTLIIEVPDNWREFTEEVRKNYLEEEWKDWSSNYIDGFIKEQE